MFNPWAQIMMLVFALTGMAIAYLEVDQRKNWWWFGIKFYVLPACLWAMAGAAEFSWVPYPDGCNSQCQMASGPARLIQTYVRMGGVLAVGLLYQAAVAFVRYYWNRIVAWDINRMRTKVNMDKWIWDQQTGEFYEITAKYDGAIKHLTRPWADRKMREYEAVRERVGWTVVSALCWVGTVAVLCAMPRTTDSLWQVFFWVMVTLSGIATAISFIMGFVVRQAMRRTGPKPLRPREDTSVEDQRVHDTGGLMDRDQLDAALRGEVGSKPIRSRPQSA